MGGPIFDNPIALRARDATKMSSRSRWKKPRHRCCSGWA